MKMKFKRLIFSISVAVAEFLIALILGLNLRAGDEMGFFLIFVYFLFPLTALILSAALARKNPFHVLPFAIVMLASEFFLPYILTRSPEYLLPLTLIAVPCVIGTAIGALIKLKKA